MARNSYYKPSGVLFDVMLGVHITDDLDSRLRSGATSAQLTKSDFVRLVLEEGLKAVHDERLRICESA